MSIELVMPSNHLISHQTVAASFPTCQHLPPCALGGTSTGVTVQQSVTASCQPLPPQAPERSHEIEHMHSSYGCLLPLPPKPASVPQLVAAFAPSCLREEQKPEGGPHVELGPKTKLRLTVCTTKGKTNTEIPPCSCTSYTLNLCDSRGKPSL